MAATKKTNRNERNFQRDEAEAALQSTIGALTMLSMALEIDGQSCEQCDGINNTVKEMYDMVRRMAV